jgi:hypothetical protein
LCRNWTKLNLLTITLFAANSGVARPEGAERSARLLAAASEPVNIITAADYEIDTLDDWNSITGELPKVTAKILNVATKDL